MSIQFDAQREHAALSRSFFECRYLTASPTS
jgi:hypothetical protein